MKYNKQENNAAEDEHDSTSDEEAMLSLVGSEMCIRDR